MFIDMDTKIPKLVHYIWLGSRPLDNLSKKCMKTWSEFLPDYSIVKWGDAECINIINNNSYAREAYNAGKFAFVSDYLRVYILYHYGGIYMDTDVQIFKPLDRFLNDDAFSCFENQTHIPTALMACTKGNAWMKMLLDDYNERHFVKPDGGFDLRTNVEVITELSKNWGFIPNGEEQIFNSGVHIYPKEFFCPIDTKDARLNVFTENTYAAHLYNGSWRSPLRQRLSKIKKTLGIDPEKLFGEKIYNLLKKI